MSRLLLLLLAVPIWLTGIPTPTVTPAPQPIVRAVLFYSPTCGHCEKVIKQDLPLIFKKYGNCLEMIGIDVTQPDGQTLFVTGLQRFNLPSGGVPFLVVGDHYMMGSVDIPEQFPGLIDAYLAQGGVDWPQIPGLEDFILQLQPTAAPTPYFTPPPRTTTTPAPSLTPLMTSSANLSRPLPGLLTSEAQTQDIASKLARDPLGNGLAILVLVGMLAIVVFSAINFSRLAGASPQPWQVWLVPILVLVGFIVSGYLAYVETAQVTAVCGPVGDCNTVQQSEYARLFGILPIGVLGLTGYVFILVAWLVGRLERIPLSKYADLALLVMTTFGLVFSIYLTFLEPFVIGATCAWCLTSAILMTALFWLTLIPGKLAYSSLFA
jgi:uncharacterized membrane protein